MTSFKIRIDDSILEDLRVRLERTRFPDQLDGVGCHIPTRAGDLSPQVG